MPVLDLGRVRLGYEEFGEGENYLLCAQQNHSLVDNYTIDLAKKGFHVFLITIRGYQPSSLATEDYGEEWYNIWAKDVCDFATSKGIDRFFYTGVSHGAGIGWTICTNHPERLLAFFSVVGGPHPKDGEETGSARMGTILASESPEKWKAHVDKMMALHKRPLRGDESPEELALIRAKEEEVREQWMRMTPEEARINPKKPFPKQKTEQELIEVLGRIDLPVLMLGGMQDPISTPESMMRSCRAVKKSKLIIYENATHGLDYEHKAEVVEDILSFARCQKLI